MKVDKKLRRIVTFNQNMQWLFIGVVLVFILNASLFILLKDDCGTFGDQFGASNALFSGLAFAGLIVTILLQRRDLRLQRKDLKMQRKELQITNKQLEGQKEQLEEQNKTLKVQRFENTFFQMLTQFQEIVNNLTFTYLDSERENRLIAEGRECFAIAFESAPHKSSIPEMKTMNTSGWYVGMRHIIKTFGKEGYMNSFSPSYFDHYFRFIYRILKFVKTSPLVTDFDEEYEYTCMLRAMLSRYELVWLYYNGLSDYGKEKLKPLIERDAMLKNLREDFLADKLGEFGTYSPSAWKKITPSRE
jgi:hypothetical protein